MPFYFYLKMNVLLFYYPTVHGSLKVLRFSDMVPRFMVPLTMGRAAGRNRGK